jgi:DNA-binding SARP family transcriptional activator
VRLEITLAGDVAVGQGDEPERHVLTGPPRVVLAALALAPAPGVPRDQLAGIVWPESMPRTWASALRTHVSKVRSLVTTVVGAGETVVSGDSGYQLVLPEGVSLVVDIDQADRALDAARRVLAGAPAEALHLATGAAERVRPPFLPGHPGRWAEHIRAHLDDVLASALELASQAATALGDGPRAVAAAEDAVKQAPLRESAHRALMAALDAAGNRAEALRVYQRARRMLADELGVDPSPDTEAAYLALLGPAPPSRPARATVRDDLSATVGGTRRGATQAPFVGREPELAALEDAWKQAVGGARHVVVVSGEAGIGKTRLTTEAARRVQQDGGLVLFGRCDQEAIVPYQPLVEALDGLVAATPADELPFLGDEAMAELGTVLPSLDRPRRPAGPDRSRLFRAVTDLVAAVAKQRPLLVVLDDLQWADDDTLLLVRHLLRRSGDAPILVVAITRDHDLRPGHALADIVHSLDRDGWVRRLPLRGLDESDVRDLLAQVHGPGDHGHAARRLVAETAGNPFLVTELSRAGDPATIGGGDIPPSVQDLVSTRLARLDQPAVELLRAGAVAGARFELDIAGAAAGLDEDALLDAADAALACGLVTEESADRYRFPHDIVRRTLVAQLSGARRRSLHRRTADAIERLRAHDVDERVAVLAHHSSAGADPAGDERAVRWARRASALATQRNAPAEAVRLCRQALAHLPAGQGATQAEITIDLGISLLAAGDEAGARTLVDAAALAQRHDRPDLFGRAALAVADAADDRPELKAVAGDLVAGATAAAASGGPGTDAAVRHARLLVRRLRLTGAPGIGDAPPPLALVRVLHDHLGSLTGVRAVDERRRLADELVVLADAAGDPRLRLVAAHEQAMAAATLGEDGTVRAALATVASVAAAHDDPLGAALVAERAVAQLVIDGRFDQVREALAVATAAWAAHGGTDGPDGANAMAARHRTVIDWLTAVPPVAPPRGVTDATGGNHFPAVPPDGPELLHALGVASLAACDAADPVTTAELRSRLAPFADLVCGLGYRTFVGAAAFHLGRLAAAGGDWAEAERHLLSALRLHSAWRARPWVALTQDALAAVLEARGRPSDREWIAGLRAEAAWVRGNLGLRPL